MFGGGCHCPPAGVPLPCPLLYTVTLWCSSSGWQPLMHEAYHIFMVLVLLTQYSAHAWHRIHVIYNSWSVGSGSFLSGVGELQSGIMNMLSKKLSSVTLPWNAEFHQKGHFSVFFTIRDSSELPEILCKNFLTMKELTSHRPITCCLGTPLNASACQCLYESKWWLWFYLHNTH